MNAHRQDMVNVELTVGELRAIVEEAIVNKYPFLAESNGWSLQDMSFHAQNLNSNHHQDADGWSGATYFFVKDVAVECAPLKEGCRCATIGPAVRCPGCPNSA